jgi:hypothetical protein
MTQHDYSTVLDAALAAYDAGLCTVRPKTDGSKAPDGAWADYQKQRPSRQELEEYFRSSPGLVELQRTCSAKGWWFDPPEADSPRTGRIRSPFRLRSGRL